MEPNVQQTVPLLGITDMTQSLRFYVEGLGFEKTIDWVVDGRIRWCWLRHGGAALMLQEFTAEAREKQRAEGKLGSGVGFSFICRDAITLYHEFLARGIEAQRPFVGNRMWVTSMTDPDGYRLEFESMTEVPEETEYDEALHRPR